MEILRKNFPGLSSEQYSKLEKLSGLYTYWNSRINVISRKDIEHLYERHVLHSLAIAKVISFEPGTKVLDVGTGGGFPGIPLAILFPEVSFHLVDSIQKKIKVVDEVRDAIGLQNVITTHCRAQEIVGSYDFVVSRAVTAMPRFVGWVRKKFRTDGFNSLQNGILYLKGGDLKEELSQFPNAVIFPISNYFDEPFFETKKVVHLGL